MPDQMLELPSATHEITGDRAGSLLRDWAGGMENPGVREQEAILVVDQWRAEHAGPLARAHNELSALLRAERYPVQVSQRLKRLATIIDKLRREPTMALSRMQDIGGCRAIVDDVVQLRAVQRRLVHNRPLARISDYVAAPRPSGYRAVHVVVEYDSRAIEIQLRTRLMHEWAVAVERFGGKIGEDLKSGRGPREVLDWLEAVSGALSIEESNGTVDDELVKHISRLRDEALQYLPGGDG